MGDATFVAPSGAAAKGRATGAEVVAARDELERVQGEAARDFAEIVRDARGEFRVAVTASQTRFDRLT